MAKRIYGPENYVIPPTAVDAGVCENVTGMDENGNSTQLSIINEKPLTLYLNSQEIVTMMTIGDHPTYLALGFLSNQAMLSADTEIAAIDVEEDIGVIVVRTDEETDFEEKMKKRIRTSGCAQGTVFGDVMDAFEQSSLAHLTGTILQSDLYSVIAKINTTPSLYLEAGAIHGTVLCEGDKPLVYMEDVGRHNAVDKVAGWMFETKTSGHNKILFTTGRLTSEMVIKTVMMQIPVLVSRSGFTAAGVELARQAGLTLIGRARGERYTILSHPERLVKG